MARQAGKAPAAARTAASTWASLEAVTAPTVSPLPGLIDLDPLAVALDPLPADVGAVSCRDGHHVLLVMREGAACVCRRWDGRRRCPAAVPPASSSTSKRAPGAISGASITTMAISRSRVGDQQALRTSPTGSPPAAHLAARHGRLVARDGDGGQPPGRRSGDPAQRLLAAEGRLLEPDHVVEVHLVGVGVAREVVGIDEDQARLLAQRLDRVQAIGGDLPAAEQGIPQRLGRVRADSRARSPARPSTHSARA